MEPISVMKYLKGHGLHVLGATFFGFWCGWISHAPDGPIEQAIEKMISQAARRGGEALGVHLELDIDLSAGRKVTKSSSGPHSDEVSKNPTPQEAPPGL